LLICYREDYYFNLQRNEWMLKEDVTPPDTLVAHSFQHTEPLSPEQLAKSFDIGDGFSSCLCCR
jgi:hypothetical protein